MQYTAEVVRDQLVLPQVEFDVPGGGMGEVTLQVAIRPKSGEPWLALFRTLDYSQINEVQTWDDGPMLLVVARGLGHYVDTRSPGDRVDLPVFPVRHLLRHRNGIVVLGDFVRMCGIDGSGVRWVSPMLADDWIEDVRLDGDNMTGRGSVNATGEWAPFRISVVDGKTETTYRDWRQG